MLELIGICHMHEKESSTTYAWEGTTTSMNGSMAHALLKITEFS
jgi:hypothetical protein